MRQLPTAQHMRTRFSNIHDTWIAVEDRRCIVVTGNSQAPWQRNRKWRTQQSAAHVRFFYFRPKIIVHRDSLTHVLTASGVKEGRCVSWFLTPEAAKTSGWFADRGTVCHVTHRPPNDDLWSVNTLPLYRLSSNGITHTLTTSIFSGAINNTPVAESISVIFEQNI